MSVLSFHPYRNDPGEVITGLDIYDRRIWRHDLETLPTEPNSDFIGSRLDPAKAVISLVIAECLMHDLVRSRG